MTISTTKYTTTHTDQDLNKAIEATKQSISHWIKDNLKPNAKKPYSPEIYTDTCPLCLTFFVNFKCEYCPIRLRDGHCVNTPWDKIHTKYVLEGKRKLQTTIDPTDSYMISLIQSEVDYLKTILAELQEEKINRIKLNKQK
ncbi:MAG: hypothetical protein WC444_06090 [Candidatus Paceibacterota bacterium]